MKGTEEVVNAIYEPSPRCKKLIKAGDETVISILKTMKGRNVVARENRNLRACLEYIQAIEGFERRALALMQGNNMGDADDLLAEINKDTDEAEV